LAIDRGSTCPGYLPDLSGHRSALSSFRFSSLR
jgi:hypothetical protein